MARTTVEVIPLSGSTDGRGIKIAATSTPGTLLHTAVSGAGKLDRIYLHIYNSHTAGVAVTIQWGGTTSPDDEVKETIPFRSGLILVMPGLILRNGLELRAFAGTTNVLVAHGEVERATVE